MLPEIRSSVRGRYGDAHAAAVSAACRSPASSATSRRRCSARPASTPGEAKNTYGTGCFLLVNTGDRDRPHRATACSRPSPTSSATSPPLYALEGSIAVTGALVQWLRDNLGIIATPPRVEALAATVDDNGGVYFVPAFSGLFAPYWRDDARGVIVGLTALRQPRRTSPAPRSKRRPSRRARCSTRSNADADVPLDELRVDGGMTANELLMQFQADILGVPVVRPR